MPAPRTLFDKVWDRHVVAEPPGLPAVLYVDLHLVHEVTSPQAFAGLAARGSSLRASSRSRVWYWVASARCSDWPRAWCWWTSRTWS